MMVKYQILLNLFVFLLLAAVSAYPASLQLGTEQPSIAASDVANLIGAAADHDNVGNSTADGNGNDSTTYISYDRAAQGQTFKTPGSALAYTLRAVTIRHTGYTSNTDATWYRMSAGGTFTIRVTDPSLGGSSAMVLSSETYAVTGLEDNIFSVNTVSSSTNGTGTWFTFNLDTPVELAPNTLYGFDISSTDSFLETVGIKDTASGGNPYADGSAYISGSGGAGANTISAAPGDRVFIVHLNAISPSDGDLNYNGKVDLYDVAVLANNIEYQVYLNTLKNIAANWLNVNPPVFKNDIITARDAIIDESYDGDIFDEVIYYNTNALTFEKNDGPEWLTITPDGILLGKPLESDEGLNTFTVQVISEKNIAVQVVLQINVINDPTDVKFLESVPFTDVAFEDEFWRPRLEINREVTVPYIFDQLEGKYDSSHNRIDNFSIAGGLMTGTPQYDFPFDDTDIYKTLEGASYSLMVSPDAELEQYLDDLIVKIAAAQAAEGDGYLYTVRTNGLANDHWGGTARWYSLKMSHELYNAGHLFEAAIAHYQATGKTSLLNIARNFANLLVDTFHDGGVEIPPGHEIVESALARLYDVTGDVDYLNLAKYFLDIRGTVTDDYSPWGTYHQDHLPVLQQNEAVGHVVRAIYMYLGMADVAARTGDYQYRDELMAALDRIWHSVNDTKAYITGGLGASHGGESFGSPYDLPHDGYCETCAQIANVMWNQRMFLFHKDGKYIDVLERTLYNSVTSGVSLDGNRFFYPNPLISTGGYTRSGWFDCNCCLGNIARMIPSVPGYVYCKDEDEIYVNLYVAGTGTIALVDNDVTLTQTGNYPWDGDMSIAVDPDTTGAFTINMRIPGWTQNQPLPSDLYYYENQSTDVVALDVNGTSVPLNINKGYVSINRTWQAGDTINISLPMAVRKVHANSKIAACAGQVALERGPIVYCAEWPDYDSKSVFHLFIPDEVQFDVEYLENMLGDSSITNKGNVITGVVKGMFEDDDGAIIQQDEVFRAIPYYAWAHRGAGQMTVWFPDNPELATPVLQPTPKEISGYWCFDEISGITAYDSSGNGIDGVLSNGLTFDTGTVSGQVGNALSFDGNDQYVDLPTGLSDFTKGCTISLWVYPTDVQNWSRFVDFGNGSSSDNIWFGRRSNSNDLAFECWSGSSSNGLVYAEDVINLNEWQMFTVTVDSTGNVRLFKDGSLIQTGTSMPTSVNRTNNYLGRSNWPADDYYQGYMDDVRVYNYNLTDSEVMAVFTASN